MLKDILPQQQVSCVTCSDEKWTRYESETLDGGNEESWRLCVDCKPAVSENKETREERGIALAIERFHEIVKVRPWTYSVPSQSGEGAYDVNLKFATCNCRDSVFRPQDGPCIHFHALRHLLSISGQCSGCHKRFVWRELVEVTEDHESLTWCPGDILCQSCGCASGVL